MTDLARWLVEAGFSDVATYIQSGNVVLTHAPRVDVAAEVGAIIEANAGFEVDVVVRDAREMRGVLTTNPFTDPDPTHLHVAFHSAPPSHDVVARVDPEAFAPEHFAVVGRDVFLHVPDGMGRSAMVPRLALVKGATVRNWNTVQRLVAMLDHP